MTKTCKNKSKVVKAASSSSAESSKSKRKDWSSLTTNNKSSIGNSSSSSSSYKKELDHLPWYTKFTGSDPLYLDYMRNEWGFESHDDTKLFEKLSLEGAQSGLSWRTILNKREAYRRFFHGFQIETVASMSSSDINVALESDTKGNEAVVKHRGKLESVVNNAQQILTLKEKCNVNFSDFLWEFVDNKPILNYWTKVEEIPSKTKESETMSKVLKKNGFKFVGPTTCYAFMQSMGFVHDHIVDTPEWLAARERLLKRDGGFQDRKQT